MQNITSLVTLAADGKGKNSIVGTADPPFEAGANALSGQSPSFLRTLRGFTTDHSRPMQRPNDQSNPFLAKPVLQELPHGGMVLPVQDLSSTVELSVNTEQIDSTGYSVSQLKDILKNLLAELSKINKDTQISPDQKSMTERLAVQLAELQHLLQESDGTDIIIPPTLANGILNNIQALRNSGLLETPRQGAITLANNMLVAAHKDQQERNVQAANTQITVDKGNSTISLDDTRINQLSDFVQKLVADARDNAGSKSDVGLSGLIKLPASRIDTRSGETLIGNIAGLGHQTGNLASDKAAVTLPINSTFNQSSWGDEIGDRVKWLIGQNVQTARLSLNPPQLGPIEVKITVQNDQMNIMFTAHHAAVRDALESAVPRLREMFGDSGLNLVDVDISQHSFSDHRGASPDIDTGNNHDKTSTDNNELSAGIALNQRISLHDGLVDYYA
jgi:Flagellar hook-length control protein FliK